MKRSSHQTRAIRRLETRSALAYWQNGKVYVYTGTQSTAQTVPAIARWLNIDASKVVLISEYTGGGFGSKITAGVSLIIPALLVEEGQRTGDDADQPRRGKLHWPCAAQLAGADESRLLEGLGASSRWTCSSSPTTVPTTPVGDAPTSGRIVSLLYQPQAMRWRGVTVLTNTPPRSAQSSPGGMQGITLMEPIIAKAARKLGLDQVAIRRINCPEGKAPFGPAEQGKRPHATSAFLKEALDRGAEQFKWNERVSRTPKRIGTKVRGVGVSLSCFVGGTIGFDGLLIIKPDGRVCFQSGIGNLGTESVIDVHRAGCRGSGRAVGEVRRYWGDSSKNLPLTCVSGGSQTTHAMTRAAHATAMEAKKKLQEIAAKKLGGKPEALRRRQRARIPQGWRRQHDSGAGRAVRHSTGRHLRWPRNATPISTD